MRIALIVLFSLSFAGYLRAQEICDNGVDDNGNGLIDLQDPACTCQGILTIGDLPDFLPNTSFENQHCCPLAFSDLDCVQEWYSGNFSSPDYIHE